MRVLVAGGTGYVGAEVVASLASAGHSLRVLVHATEPPLPEAAGAVLGDVSDAASLEAAAAGCDAIVNLVAILDGPDAAFEAVNAGGPRNVVAAANAHGIRRIVHMSALGVSVEHAPLTRYWGRSTRASRLSPPATWTGRCSNRASCSGAAAAR